MSRDCKEPAPSGGWAALVFMLFYTVPHENPGGPSPGRPNLSILKFCRQTYSEESGHNQNDKEVNQRLQFEAER